MESVETQEIPSKETRGRPGRLVRLTVDLPMADAQAALNLAGKRMKQLGEFVALDRIISEAIQSLAKSFGSQD